MSLIHAEDKASALGAVRSLSGDFSDRVNDIISSLDYLRVWVESSFDFATEEIPQVDSDFVTDKIINLKSAIQLLCSEAKAGKWLCFGADVAIVGPPNAGKSSLFNWLIDKNRSIVTDIAGTTRDTISDVATLPSGIKCNFIDTAGIRESSDVVEQLGVKRSIEAISKAEVVVVVFSRPEVTCATTVKNWLRDLNLTDKYVLVVFNKSDLPCREVLFDWSYKHVNVSVKNKQGLDLLDSVFKEFLSAQNYTPKFSVRNRQLLALKASLTEVDNALESVSQGFEVVAEHLRLAEACLFEITGKKRPDDLLGIIFRVLYW